MNIISDQVPGWWFIFVPECDGFLGTRDAFKCQGHRVIRHYPGTGSVAMVLIINVAKKCLLQSVQTAGRCMAISFGCKKQRFSQHFVLVHGAHGEQLPLSLSDAASLVKKHKRSEAVICMGDFNVELLPTLAGDPFLGVDRWKRHIEERILFGQFCSSLGLESDIPTMVGEPGGSWADVCWDGASCSRMPLGLGCGLPSLLDHACSRHCKVSSEVSWNGDIGDHAFLVVRTPASIKVWKPRAKTTFVCGDLEQAESWFKRLTPGEFVDVDSALTFFRRAQCATECKRSAAARRREREPSQIKELRRRIHACNNSNEKRVLQQQLFRSRVHVLLRGR